MSQVTNSEIAFTGNVITTPMLEISCNKGKIKRRNVWEGSWDYTKFSLSFVNTMNYFWRWNGLKVVCTHPLEKSCPRGKI